MRCKCVWNRNKEKGRADDSALPNDHKLVIDALKAFAVAGINGQHQIFPIVDHCIFLLNMR